MTETFNGCSFTDVWASPRNWDSTTSKKSLKDDWYVMCVFYDPRFEHKYKNKGFQFRRRVNKLRSIEERQAAISTLLESMPALLVEEGFNPITKEYMAPPAEPELEQATELNGTMPLNMALHLALNLSEYEHHTNGCVRSILKYFIASAEKLGYHEMPIHSVITLHVDLIMDNLVKNVRDLSNKTYNRYLAYLSSLFSTLKKKGLTDKIVLENYIRKETIVEPRQVMTVSERTKVYSHLSINHPSFWLYCMIFFHSGGREIELLRLKYEDIDLDNLVYKTLVKKRKKHSIVFRPIKKIAVKYFEKAMINAKKGDYIFSVGLVPGSQCIRRDQITRRWKKHVKNILGITADIYSLKHSNLTEISDRTSAKVAARAAGHTSTAMVIKHYDVNYIDREMDNVRSMTNEFAPQIKSRSQIFCNAPAENRFIGRSFQLQPQKDQAISQSSVTY